MKIILSFFLISFSLHAQLFGESFKDEKGKPLARNSKAYLIVNIATRCGFTGQLGGIQKLYDKYKDKGLLVIGIPSNEFGSQTPEASGEVGKFCLLNYNVNFPILKIDIVKGSKKHKIMAKIFEQKADMPEIAWNFEKFILDSNGKLVERFKSIVSPESSALDVAIQKALGAASPKS